MHIEDTSELIGFLIELFESDIELTPDELEFVTEFKDAVTLETMNRQRVLLLHQKYGNELDWL